jgi:hypothetical protein
VHKQPFAALELRLSEERVVRGREHLGNAACLEPAQRARNRHQLSLVHCRELGLPAPADDAHDPVTFVKALGRWTKRRDFACQLEAGDVLRRSWRRRIAALALVHVGPVDAGSANSDQNLAGAGFRIWMFLDDYLFVADRRCAHRAAIVCIGQPAASAQGPVRERT